VTSEQRGGDDGGGVEDGGDEAMVGAARRARLMMRGTAVRMEKVGRLRIRFNFMRPF
jgi:hypothetical protein